MDLASTSFANCSAYRMVSAQMSFDACEEDTDKISHNLLDMLHGSMATIRRRLIFLNLDMTRGLVNVRGAILGGGLKA